MAIEINRRTFEIEYSDEYEYVFKVLYFKNLEDLEAFLNTNDYKFVKKIVNF